MLAQLRRDPVNDALRPFVAQLPAAQLLDVVGRQYGQDAEQIRRRRIGRCLDSSCLGNEFSQSLGTSYPLHETSSFAELGIHLRSPRELTRETSPVRNLTPRARLVNPSPIYCP